MLDRLEEKGLVVRDPNPEDRRSFLIRVTDEGASIATRLRRRLEDFEEDVRQRAGPRAEKGFQAVLRAIADITRIELRERKET
jgi:DNA-binding MarR family transcriptional regulator